MDATEILCYALSSVLLGFLGKVLISRLKFVYALRKIPWPTALPVVGNAVQLRGSLEDFFSRLRGWGSEFGDIYLIWVGLRPFIFIYRAEAVQPLLSSSAHIDKSHEYQFLRPWLGSGLIVSTGEKWHKRRKLLTPTFHAGLQKDYYKIVASEAEVLVKCLGSNVGGGGFDIFPYTKRAALDTICKCAMGYELNAQTNHNNEYVQAVHRVCTIAQKRFTNIFIASDAIFKHTPLGKEHARCLGIIHDFVGKVIAERKFEWNGSVDGGLNNSDKKPQTFLDLLLMAQENEGLTDDDLRDEVNTFMFAGHDTVGTCIAWTLYALGRHPEYQEKIVEEYEKITGDGLAGYESITKLQWLDACLKESLRIYPVAPLIARQIYRPITLQGHDIPVGSTVLVNSFLLHRDPRHFPEPEIYRPERFLPDQPRPVSFAFIPFSAGSRNCIGSRFAMLELKVLLLTLLRTYRFHAPDSEDKLRFVSQLVLDNVGGLRISITPRQH